MASKTRDQTNDDNSGTKEKEGKIVAENWWKKTPLDPSPLLQRYNEGQNINPETPSVDVKKRRQGKNKSRKRKERVASQSDILKAKVSGRESNRWQYRTIFAHEFVVTMFKKAIIYMAQKRQELSIH